jgi:ATP-dependent 26S proteasome regulatory subunit
MAKAVANATTAAFITMVGSEFVQKYLGEGPRMVRDVFRLAREHSPAIVFIDEVGRYPPSLHADVNVYVYFYDKVDLSKK